MGLLDKNGNKVSTVDKYKALSDYMSGEGLDKLLAILQTSNDIGFVTIYLKLLPYFKAQKVKSNKSKGTGNKQVVIELPVQPNVIMDESGNIVGYDDVELPNEDSSKTDNEVLPTN